jgi:hypothetical protein
MPFHYNLNTPDFGVSLLLVEQLIPEKTFIEPNTAVALLGAGDERVILRAAGRGCLTAWYAQPGQSLQSGEPFARMDADGEDVPYGHPYIIAERISR